LILKLYFVVNSYGSIIKKIISILSSNKIYRKVIIGKCIINIIKEGNQGIGNLN
jgi:hypothetical protein